LKASKRLALADALDQEEMGRLYRAAFRARLCNIAFNGLGGCEGEISPDQEGHRMRLERDFMAARDHFFASPGYRLMRRSQKGAVEAAFLKVVVTDQNLAPEP
jgi:hypothetical protein